jgi:hypothetical protein
VGMRICASSQAKKIVWEEERRRHPSAPFVAVERNSKGGRWWPCIDRGKGSGLTGGWH